MAEFISNRYRLLEKLGKGGLGEVYRVFDGWENREVAIKTANLENLAKSELEYFKQEFELSKKLKHPGLVEAYDFGFSDGRPYFSMEYVQGRSLEESFKDEGWENFRILVAEICEVLGFIHQRGIIHCDLKPDNIKVTTFPFRIKLLDFGLAEERGSKINQEPKGTLDFMSPEVFQKRPLDERSDLYSLGVILYHAVTSRLPFSYSDPVQMVSAHLEEIPMPAKQFNPQIPDTLNEVILKLLSKSPDDRFRNAPGLKEFLEKKEKIDLGSKTFPIQHLFSGGLFNRQKELNRLWNGLETALKRTGKFFLVEGEAGIGKTELLDELKLKSGLSAINFFKVRCLEKESETYVPIIQVISHLFPYLKNKCRLLIAKYGQPLKLLIPQLEEELAGVPTSRDGLPGEEPEKDKTVAIGFVEHPASSGQSPAKQTDLCKTKSLEPGIKFSVQDRESLISGLADFLIEASTVFPFAICFEDLGYADLGTVSFLEKLSQDINQSRIFLCASSRPGQMEEKKEVKNLINGLTNKDWFQTIKLDRFNPEEARAFIASKLAGSEPHPDAVFYLFSHSSGNPLFLLEIMKLFVQKGMIALKKGQWVFDLERIEEEKVSNQIGNILLGNLARYDQKTNDFLKCASLIGPRFDLESAKFLSGLSDDQLFEILFVLLKDEVLRKIPEQSELTYEFSSQSLQKLLYETFSPIRRKKLHAKLAGFLEEKQKNGIEQPKEKLAYHFVNSSDYQKAYKYSLEAAEETGKRFAHTQTLKHINNALKSATGLKDQGKHLDALMKRGDFYNSIGELDKALKDYKEILKKAKGAKDERFMGEVYGHVGAVYIYRNDFKKSLHYSKVALKMVRKINDMTRVANSLNNIGITYRLNGQYQMALKYHNEALHIYESLNNREMVARTLVNIGIVHRMKNDYVKAKDYYGQHLDIFRSLDIEEGIARSLNNLSNVHYFLGEFGTSISYLLESLELNREIGNEKEMCYNYENLGQNFLEIGDYEKSLEYSQKAINLAQQIGVPRSGDILLNMAGAYLEIGDYKKAEQNFQESLKFAKQINDKMLIASILLNWTKLYMLLNNTEEQKQLLSVALKIIKGLKDDKLFLELYEFFGIVNSKEGKTEESLVYFRKSEELVDKLELKNKKMSLDLAFYDFYSKLGQAEKAQKHLEKVRELAETTQSKSLKAEFYLKSAENEMNEGNLDRSSADVKKSLEIAEEIKKPELIWRIHHLLGKLNVGKKDFESAYKELQKASEVLKGLINNIKDEDLKKSYLQDKDKKELLEDIKKVAGLMVGEKV